MKNLQLTTLIIERDPSWRPTISTACHITGREYSEELLYKVTYAISDSIELDEETMEIIMDVSDSTILEAIEAYAPAKEAEEVDVDADEGHLENLEQRLQNLEAATARLETQLVAIEQVGQLEPSEPEVVTPKLPELTGGEFNLE